jgi:nicotinate-nucleotide pyrophosphorylase
MNTSTNTLRQSQLPDPIEIALAEDVGSGDLTSTFFIPEQAQSRARIFAKEDAWSQKFLAELIQSSRSSLKEGMVHG